MFNNPAYGYTYNPQMPYNYQAQNNNYSQPQQRPAVFPAVYVSDKAEVNSYPADQSNNPSFFYNRVKEEVYIKQYDSTGAAPVKTYRLITDDLTEEKQPAGIKLYSENLQALNDKIDGLKSIIENLTVSKMETVEIKGKKQ